MVYLVNIQKVHIQQRILKEELSEHVGEPSEGSPTCFKNRQLDARAISPCWLIAYILSLVLVLGGCESQPEELVPEQVLPNETSMSAKSLSFSNYEDGRLTSRFQVDQMVVKPRKFGIFRVKSINEALLLNALFVFHQYSAAEEKVSDRPEGASKKPDLTDGIQGLAELRGVGRLTRAVVDGMTLEFLHDKEMVLRAQMEKAFIDLQKNESRFEKSVFQLSRQKIILLGEEAFWDKKNKKFIIPGPYRILEGGDRKTGTGIAIDLAGNIFRRAGSPR